MASRKQPARQRPGSYREAAAEALRLAARTAQDHEVRWVEGEGYVVGRYDPGAGPPDYFAAGA